MGTRQPENREEIINGLLSPFEKDIIHSKYILDAGTGTGALIPILKRRFPQSQIASFDLSQRMLQFAQERDPVALLIQCDVHFLPLKHNTFDFIFCHNSFPHFWEMPQALLGFNQVLMKGGKLLILHDISREMVNTIHQNAKSEVIHHDLLPDSSDLYRMLLNCCFEVIDIQDTDKFFIVFAKIS